MMWMQRESWWSCIAHMCLFAPVYIYWGELLFSTISAVLYGKLTYKFYLVLKQLAAFQGRFYPSSGKKKKNIKKKYLIHN